ncbi:tachykinin-like peptides receptor 99D isoform X1 [Bactrocera tryoni]|uniref:tachykinin-like peptides receptor 99D isoform X1 n=1 Tax=Bactrocera tryoni TaxID=59916 RepID=UPI001A9687D4|nr:tachykinin-like peptides receptor 99D isoform X1 [Bactrocera tryoni]XP_039970275.1 tachykinin-like peptides receptor 99D isoform X1 [Bactrocera tryoni]
MLDSHTPPTTTVSDFESIEPYKVDTSNEFGSSGGGGGRGELDVIIASETSRAAFGGLAENLQDNYSQLIGTTSAIDWCNQSLLLYGINNCSMNIYSGINDTMVDEDISFILPWWRQVLWSILFGGMVLVATGGNLIVVWVVMTTKRMRTVTNYFIVNLSIADAMVSSLNVTFNYIYMLDNDWPFGELYCKISQFIATLSISASVFTLMAISIDRYVAIMKPLKPRMSKRCNLGIAAFIWIASIAISCPMLFFFTTGEVELKDGTRIVCYAEWPDGPTNHSQQENVYNIVFMILTYILPIISMTVTYSRVGIELWGSKTIGEYTPRQVENVRSKRRVVKMMMVVVLIFAVCWLPFHIYFIVTSCYPALTQTPFIQEVYLGIYWLAMSNSMYNPIIYCWMNSRFRYGFKRFFRWCPFVKVDESLNRRDNMTSRYSCSGSPDHNRIKRNVRHFPVNSSFCVSLADTQRSFLYTCPGSPKNRRVASHYGMLRNSTIVSHRDPLRHSAPIGTNNTGAYHQRFTISHCGNSHELTSLTSLSGAPGAGQYGIVMKAEPIKVALRNGSAQQVSLPLWPATAETTDTESAATTPPLLPPPSTIGVGEVVGVEGCCVGDASGGVCHVDETNVRAAS